MIRSRRIQFEKDGVWVGDGIVDEESPDGYVMIRDCAALLGPDDDASNAAYRLIEQDIDCYTRRGEVAGADGVYSWAIDDYPREKVPAPVMAAYRDLRPVDWQQTPRDQGCTNRWWACSEDCVFFRAGMTVTVFDHADGEWEPWNGLTPHGREIAEFEC